jgi:hypothetical protein
LNDSTFSSYDIHSRIFPGNEIFLSAQQSVLREVRFNESDDNKWNEAFLGGVCMPGVDDGLWLFIG